MKKKISIAWKCYSIAGALWLSISILILIIGFFAKSLEQEPWEIYDQVTPMEWSLSYPETPQKIRAWIQLDDNFYSEFSNSESSRWSLRVDGRKQRYGHGYIKRSIFDAMKNGLGDGKWHKACLTIQHTRDYYRGRTPSIFSIDSIESIDSWDPDE